MDESDKLTVAIVALASGGGLLLVLQALIAAHLCWRTRGWWAWKCCRRYWDCCGWCWYCWGCPTRCCGWFWEYCWCWWEPEYDDELTGETKIVELPGAGHCKPPVKPSCAHTLPHCEHRCYNWMTTADGPRSQTHGVDEWKAPPAVAQCCSSSGCCVIQHDGAVPMSHMPAAPATTSATYIVEPVRM